LDRARRALLGFVERFFVAPAVGRKQIRYQTIVDPCDRSGQRLNGFGGGITALSSAGAILTGHDVAIGIGGIGDRYASVATIAKANFTRGAVERVMPVGW